MTREEFLAKVYAKNEEDRKLAERMQEERMDFLLRIHHLAGASCTAMDNGTMLIIFFSSIFFGLALLVAFGELARHSDFSRRHSHAEARSAALLCVGWIAVALAIGATMLALLVRHCA